MSPSEIELSCARLFPGKRETLAEKMGAFE